MSSSLHLSVIPVGPDGEVILSHVREPSCGMADAYVRELFDEKESERHFAEVVKGLSLSWYRHTSMEACLREKRNPTTSDCYKPGEIRSEVPQIQERLAALAPRLPVRYRFQKSSRVGEWLSDARIFYGDRLFRVGADWGVCKAWWSKDRPIKEAVATLLSDGPDIEHDLRSTSGFRCIDARWDGRAFVPGDPVTLVIGSETPAQQFGPFLALILDFCDKAEAGGFLVFTSRG